MQISSEQALSDIRGTPVEDNEPSTFSIEYRPVYLFYCNYDIITRSAAEESMFDKTKDAKSEPPASSASYSLSNGIYMPDSLNSDIYMTGSSDICMTDSSESSSLPINNNIRPQAQLKLQQQNSSDNGGNSGSSGSDSFENNKYMEEVIDDEDNNVSSLENEVCKHCGISDSIDDVNTIFFCDLCDLGVHQLCENPPISSYEMHIDPWYCRDCSKLIGSTLPQDKIPQFDHDNDRSNSKRQRLE